MVELDDILKKARADDPEQTAEEKKDEINEEVIIDLLNHHEDFPPVSIRAHQTRIQLIETARWTLAMDDVYDIKTRRLAAQKKIAEHCEPTNPGKADSSEEHTKMTLQAIQSKVRRVFEGRYGKKSAQQHLDEVLKDVEDDYKARMEAR